MLPVEVSFPMPTAQVQVALQALAPGGVASRDDETTSGIWHVEDRYQWCLSQKEGLSQLPVLLPPNALCSPNDKGQALPLRDLECLRRPANKV